MKWKVVEVEGGAIVVPEQELTCPICGYPLLMHDFRAARASQGFYHVDVHMKCPNCSLWLTFGIPISEGDFEKLVNSPYNSKILTSEVLKVTPEDIKNEVAERLRKWGYW